MHKRATVTSLILLCVTVMMCAAEDRRPAPGKRAFKSVAVEAEIERVAAVVQDATLQLVFRNCYPSTLDTTVRVATPADSFVITGDIDAMWLRDSANQLLPYVRLAAEDSALRGLLQGAVRRHARSILIDSYANAFNYNASGKGWQSDDRKPRMTAAVFEGKWEIDSLANAVHFAHSYWAATNDTSCFDVQWQSAMDRVVATFVEQQASSLEMHPNPPYTFRRNTQAATDTLMLNGMGAPTARCGLVRSAFRPSDDATTLPFLVPSNAFAVVAMRELSELWSVLGNLQKAKTAHDLAEEINTALQKHALIQTADGPIWAYEVDGFGSSYFMDDANQPSLLGLPLFGFCSIDDPIYQRTRKAILSASRNPYFFTGNVGSGVGGPHVGLDYVWPMSIIVQAMTSQSDAEISQCLKTLKTTALYGSKLTPGMGYAYMHEAFLVTDAGRFTRPWFAWANALFGDLIVKLAKERPYLLK